MATALTGSLGAPGSQLGLLQLGGPPLINSYARSLSAKALPLLGHAYANDGVTPNATTATFSVLNRPSLKATTANGGYDAITLEVAAPVSGLTQGNVVRLTEVGGSFRGFVYSGIAESFPDSITRGSVKHEIALVPFGVDLSRVHSQGVYTTPTDVSQVVRDAVALTQHCSCDGVSVAPLTGVQVATSDVVDFSNQTVQQILDACRSIAGPTWYWYCDELGRVWFQSMGSGPLYTIPQAQYEERTSNGGSIENRLNDVFVIGAIPEGGTEAATQRYTGSSQSSIGIRSLNPALHLPGVADQATVTLIANNVGATLDRVWNRLQVKIPTSSPLGGPGFLQRIHGSQPGGAMVRTWEPGAYPMGESEVGAGYAGPYLAQTVEYGGLYQLIEAGDMPVTSQSDIDNLVKSLVARSAAAVIPFPSPTLSSHTILQTATTQTSGGRLSVADLTPRIRVDLGNLPDFTDAAGVFSAAGYDFRLIDASGNLILDGNGVAGPFTPLGSITNVSQGSTAGTGGWQTITGTTINFTLARRLTIFALGSIALIDPTVGDSGFTLLGSVLVDGAYSASNGPQTYVASGLGGNMTPFAIATLASGSHSVALGANQTSGHNWTATFAYLYLFRLGG